MVELSQSQDDEVGDGTTGVVVLAGALLGEAEGLLEKGQTRLSSSFSAPRSLICVLFFLIVPGIHPLRIARGYEIAADIALKAIANAAETIPFSLEDREGLLEHVLTTLNSKIVNMHQRKMAEVRLPRLPVALSPLIPSLGCRRRSPRCCRP